MEANEEWLERRYLRMEQERIDEAVIAWQEQAAECSSLRCPTLGAR